MLENVDVLSLILNPGYATSHKQGRRSRRGNAEDGPTQKLVKGYMVSFIPPPSPQSFVFICFVNALKSLTSIKRKRPSIELKHIYGHVAYILKNYSTPPLMLISGIGRCSQIPLNYK